MQKSGASTAAAPGWCGISEKMQWLLNALDGVVIQEILDGFFFTGIIIIQQKCIELLHVTIRNGEKTGTGGHENLICQGHAGLLVPVPEELAACAPYEGIQGFFGGGRIGGYDRFKFGACLRFCRNGRQVICAGDANGTGAQLSPLQSFVPGDVFIQLAPICKSKGFIQTPKKKASRIAHIENCLNIVQLDTGDIDALQNGLCLWKGNISAFHSHAAIDIFVPFLFGKEQTLLRGHVKSVWIMHDASASSAAGFYFSIVPQKGSASQGEISNSDGNSAVF